MSGSGGKGGGRPSGSRARSVGAAGAGSPNGAILDDTEEVLLQRKQRFKAWSKGFRNQKLKEGSFMSMYKTPSPVKGNS